MKVRLLLENDNISSSGFNLPLQLRETLLQDSTASTDIDLTTAEIVAQICSELAYGSHLHWRALFYTTLHSLYHTPHGKLTLQALHSNGGLMDDLAKAAFGE